MRGLLSGVGTAILISAIGVPGAMAQRAPATFIPPAVGDERFLESWFGAELRSAGLKPLWTDAGLEGYRTRYRLTFAAGSVGVTIVTIDVEQDGTGTIISRRMRPGGMIEEGQRVRYIPGKLAWADRREVNGVPLRRLRRMFEAQDFFRRAFRVDEVQVESTQCSDGVGYLVEMRDRKGYNAITRNNCDVQDVRALIDTMMQLGGGWPKLGRRFG